MSLNCFISLLTNLHNSENVAITSKKKNTLLAGAAFSGADMNPANNFLSFDLLLLVVYTLYVYIS